MNLVLRHATIEDAALLLAWRNDPLTRAMSRTEDLVTPEAHQAWLTQTLADPARTLLIAERDGEAVATVRRDRTAGGMELSWTVAPDARGRGYGRAALIAAIPPGVEALARIKPGNEASRRIARAAGFEHAGDEAGLEIWRRAAR